MEINMFDWILKLFKKKPKKKTYKKSDFTKYRYRKGQREYYCEQTNEWLYWYLLVDLVTDEEDNLISLETFDERKDLDFKNEGFTSQEVIEGAQRYTSTDSYKSAIETIMEDNASRNSRTSSSEGYSSYGSSSSSGDYDSYSSSSSSSSYDSGSSSSFD